MSLMLNITVIGSSIYFNTADGFYVSQIKQKQPILFLQRCQESENLRPVAYKKYKWHQIPTASIIGQETLTVGQRLTEDGCLCGLMDLLVYSWIISKFLKKA